MRAIYFTVLLSLFLMAINAQAKVLINNDFLSANLFLDQDTYFDRQAFNSTKQDWKNLLKQASTKPKLKHFSRRDIGRFTVVISVLNESGLTNFSARFKLANFKDIDLYVIQDNKQIFKSDNFSKRPYQSLSGLGVSDSIFIPKGESKIVLSWSGFNVGVFSNLTIWKEQDTPENLFQFMSLMALGMILGLSLYHLLLAIFDKSLISLMYVCYGIPVVILFLAYQGIFTDIFGLIDVYGRIYCISFLITSHSIVWLVFLLLNANLYLKHGLPALLFYSFLVAINILLFIMKPSLAIHFFEPMLTLSWFVFVAIILLVAFKGVKLPTYFVYLWCPIMASLGALTIFSSTFQKYYSQELSYILLCADFFVMSLLLSSRVGRARQAMAVSASNQHFVSQLSELLKDKVMPKAKLLESYGDSLVSQGMKQLGSSLSQEAIRFQNSVRDLEGASFAWTSQLEEANLNSIFNNIRQQFQYLAAKKSLTFQLEVNLPKEDFIVDKRALEHILTNLLSNALRYTEQGYITLKVSLNSQQNLELEVIDTGPGVDANVLPNLFKPFSSVANAKHSSHGLGLYICHKILSSLGGKISYEGGGGGRFLVTVPLANKLY